MSTSSPVIVLRQPSKVRAAISTFPWAETPIGRHTDWSSQLGTLVEFVLASGQPMFVAWGANRTLIFNDAFAELLGQAKYDALGQDCLDVIEDGDGRHAACFHAALAGHAQRVDDVMLPNAPQDTVFSITYAPINGSDGEVLGVHGTCIDTTELVVSERRRIESEAALAEERAQRQEALARQAFLLELSDALRSKTTGAEIMQYASDRLGVRLKANRVFYAEIAGSLMSVECEYADGVRSLIGVHDLEAFGPNLLAAYRAQAVIEIDDVAGDERLGDVAREGLADRQVGSFVDVVLFNETKFVGLLAVQSRVARDWTADEQSLIREVAEGMKVAVERSRAEEAAQRSAVRHRLRAELGDLLQGMTEPAEIMRAVSGTIGAHLGVEQAYYYRIENEHFIVDEGWSTDGDASMIGSHALADFAAETIVGLRAGEMLKIDDTRTRADDAAFAALGIVATLSMPLYRDGQWVAGIHVHQRSPRDWTADDEALLREVAGHAWAAMERARAQQDLKALNETLEHQVAERSAERNRLWSLSQDMFARANYDGRMLAVSPAWGTVLGWSETQLLSRNYASLLDAPDREATETALRLMAENGRPTRFENRMSTSDGGWKDIEWTVTPEEDGQHYVAVGRDMSGVKAQELALLQTQEQLRQSQKLEAMGQLTGGVAHDFNNLLTPIVGSLDMLARPNLAPERQIRLIERALESAERARLLVQRLLAFARRQPLQAKAVDVGGLVENMAELVRATLGPSIAVVTEVASDLPPAQADHNQLEMALLNLAVNARDAMPNGGTLTIAADLRSTLGDSRHNLARGQYIRLRVLDTGTGMDEATLAKAVEPFFSTKGIGRGTGLGLSMVHGLAAQLGGALRIESVLDEGTTVELWLPISADAVGGGSVAAEGQTGVPTRGTILLVDDEILVRTNTAEMLGDLDFDVVEAASAEEALELVRAGARPDILVTDHLMPGMNGADLARELTRLLPGLPVLIVSGYAEVEGVAPDMARLAKPFRATELAESLARLALPEQQRIAPGG